MTTKISILTFLLACMALLSCKDDGPKASFKENITPSEIQNLSNINFILSLDKATTVFEVFNWTKTDFGFAASTTYSLQMDKARRDFTTPVEIASTNNILSASITVGDMNKKLLEMGLDTDVASDIQIRVVATIGDKVPSVYSDTKTITVTPYATSFSPIYMVGDALNGWNWNAGTPVEVLSSAPKIYETVAKFTNGNAFRFFAQQDWGPTSYNYPFFTTVSASFENAFDNDSNLKFIGTTGYYKVTVDLKNKTVAMLSVAEPVLYMTGAALNGWSWDPGKPIKLTYLKPGVFEATATFSKDTFRFFAQADWGPTSYNYPFFTTVNTKFENANDGDKNLRFIGTPGSYKITVNLNKLTVDMNP